VTIRYLLFSGHTPNGKASHKVWAQASGNFGYATFWGPYNGPYHHKAHAVQGQARQATDFNVKVGEGYSVVVPPTTFRTYVETTIAQLSANIEMSGLSIDKINAIAKGYSQSAVALTGAEQHCKFCQVYSQNETGTTPRIEWNATKCAFCKTTAGHHTPKHPHWASDCPMFSWLPMPKELPTAQAASNCEFCASRSLLGPDEKADWLEQVCKCGILRGLHAGMHPHGRKGCATFALPDCELCAAQAKTPEENVELMKVICQCGAKAAVHGWVHPHSQSPCKGFARLVSAEPNAPELPLADLPCDCGHWLNVHAAQGEIALRSCLLITCSCEFYKRTCSECGEVTRTTWRHASSCARGKFERKGTHGKEAIRAPRRISHLLNEL